MPSDTARGYAYSIYVLLGLVFGIIAVIVGIIVRTIRREERQRAERERLAAAQPPAK